MTDHPSIWTDPATFEDRVNADLDIIQGVLELAHFADYVDRKHGDAPMPQLTDAAIYNACFGASRIVDDLRECVEQLLTDHLKQKAGGEQ